MDVLIKIYAQTGEKFICIIDEWDAVLREYDNDNKIEDEFIKLLRRLFKGDESKKIFAGVYMTGILPIKKYKTESALNNFKEYSVISPKRPDKYFGFTRDADTAISQIKRKEYSGRVLEYTDNLLLVGINYDKESKTHSYVIEKYNE